MVLAAALVGLASACVTPTRAAPTPVVIYDSNPSPLPGNVVSLGYQATSTSEFGDHIEFASTERKLQEATVTFSDWALKADYPALTDPTGWDHPITLNIYVVAPGDSLGSLLGSVTQVVHIPWRPPADVVNCTGGRFQSTPGPVGTNCFNGLAFQATFDLAVLGLTAPDEVIWGVAYNTETHGPSPIGGPGPYNSLNVGADGGAPAVGTDVDPAGAFLDSTWTGNYCDLGVGGIGTFRSDSGCWAGYTPEIEFTAI